MRHSLRFSTHLLTLLLLCGYCILAAAEAYRWTDAEGQVHFGDRPPQTGARTVPLPGISSAPTATPEERLEKQRNLLRAFEEERRQTRDASEQTQRDMDERQRNCIEARDRLQSYERSSGIYDLDATGQRVFMDESQREQFMAERLKDVETWCGE